MEDKIPGDNKSATAYLLNRMQSVKKEGLHHPEAFIIREPGLIYRRVKMDAWRYNCH